MAVDLLTATLDLGYDAVLNDIKTRTDAGAAAGVLEVRTGAAPGVANAAGGTLLVSFALADPAWTGPSAQVLTLDADPDLSATAAATGTAGHARVKDSDGNAVVEFTSVTASGGGGDLEISSTSITSGQTVNVLTGSVSKP